MKIHIIISLFAPFYRVQRVQMMNDLSQYITRIPKLSCFPSFNELDHHDVQAMISPLGYNTDNMAIGLFIEVKQYVCGKLSMLVLLCGKVGPQMHGHKNGISYIM